MFLAGFVAGFFLAVLCGYIVHTLERRRADEDAHALLMHLAEHEQPPLWFVNGAPRAH